MILSSINQAIPFHSGLLTFFLCSLVVQTLAESRRGRTMKKMKISLEVRPSTHKF